MVPEKCERGVQRVTGNAEITESLPDMELSDSFDEMPRQNFCNHDSFVEVSHDDLKQQVFYKIADAMTFGDSIHSLDDPVKNIQIEESSPAEGLISILKKRHAAEEDLNGEQFQQKQSRRRVRFKEPTETSHKDDSGSDSYLSLSLLCTAITVLILGGMILYCTFTDEHSSICTNFLSTMELYYTKLQRRIQELKQWTSFS
ncbi:consortin [Protopterus annectens]|uniref:consortin n=1 Tax=Protopterus annectens TaxID=7888 RepID=UPI001CFA1A53|nr:consortin [Protopterus annectens]